MKDYLHKVLKLLGLDVKLLLIILASTKVRQLSVTRRYPIGTCSQTALLLLRQLFDKSSTALRLFFDNDSKDCRRTVEEQWEKHRRNVGAGIACLIRKKLYRSEWFTE